MLLITFSRSDMLMRAETPEAWFTNSLARAAKATSSTSSRNQSGMRSSMPQSRPVHASCAVMRMAACRSWG